MKCIGCDGLCLSPSPSDCIICCQDCVALESVECILHICLFFCRSNIRRHEKLCSAVEFDCGPVQTVGRLISEVLWIEDVLSALTNVMSAVYFLAEKTSWMSSEGTASDPIVLIMNAFLLCFLLNQWTGKVSFSV